MKITVVTATIGERRSKLLTPAIVADGVDYVAFSDKPISHPVWEIRQVARSHDDSVRDAKRYKVLLRDYVDSEYSIWCDRHCRLTGNPRELVEKYLDDADLALVKHWRRDVYHEAKACRQKGKDDLEVIERQVERLRAEGFPTNSGLYYGGCVIRRNAGTEAFDRLWWDLINSGSRRDQISLPVAVVRAGVRLREIRRGELRRVFRILAK